MSRSVYWLPVESTCSNKPWTGPISANPMRCTRRGCRNVNGVTATQPTIITTIASAKTAKPIQLSSLRAAKMWLRLERRPVVNTKAMCVTMKNRNQMNTMKWSDRAVWMLKRRLIRLNRVDNAGDMPSPVRSAAGAAMKMVKK
jgi:hypothetical protein